MIRSLIRFNSIITMALKPFLLNCEQNISQLRNQEGFYDIAKIQQNYSSIKVVLGNEACDLDSAVCTIAYAKLLDFINKDFDSITVMPLLNIPRKDFVLRTEVKYWLNKVNISENQLYFRDDLDLKILSEAGNLDLYLVDHNVLSPSDAFLEPYVDSIIDHHQLERTSTPVHGMVVEPVGSCATLIVDQILDKCPENFEDSEIAQLLYGAILVDTINFNESAKKATPKDLMMIEHLEKILQVDASQRTETFDELMRVKADISNLTSKDILRKDLKVISANNLTIALSSVPLLVVEFLTREGIERDLNASLSENSWDVLIIMGITFSEDVRRDLAIVSYRKSHKEQISRYLKEADEELLELESLESTFVRDCSLFDQKNTAASRKVVLPLVRRWMDDQR